MVIFKLVISGFVILFVFSAIFSSRVRLFPFFEASSQNCGSLCYSSILVIMKLTSHGEGFSIYKTTHRIWLRIFSIALQEELKVLYYT